jgi:hypothetical protein
MCFDRNINGNRDVKFLIGIIGQRNLLYEIDYSKRMKKPKNNSRKIHMVISCAVCSLKYFPHKFVGESNLLGGAFVNTSDAGR